MSNPSFDSRWPADFFQENRPITPEIEDTTTAVTRAKRRRLLLWLFVLTLLSTAWVGVTAWSPVEILLLAWSSNSLTVVRQLILANWLSAVLFSVSLLSILTAHELGHYFMTRFYGIRATLPIFIPFPLHQIGTCGALIVMDSSQADRKQMFDIGIAGPLAGLVIAIPVLILGMQTDFAPQYSPHASFQLGQPLLIQWMAQWLKPDLLVNSAGATNSYLNPLLMAGWAGLLVTGLNMMPMGQLDGGHVAFGIFGRRAIFVSYAALLGCIFFIFFFKQYGFVLMLFLVILIGLRHPPSSDDTVRVGIGRSILGIATMALPILCIPINPFTFLM